jgi:hypothetical protein
MASDGEGGSDLPSHRRNGARAPPAPFTTTSLLENASTIHAMTTVPPWPDTDLPFEQRHAHQEGKRAQAHTRPPCTEQEAAQ